jgi:hypothetical protein
MNISCLSCIEFLWKKRAETQYVSMSNIVIVEQPRQQPSSREIIRSGATNLIALDVIEDDIDVDLSVDPDILPTPSSSSSPPSAAVKIDRTPVLREFLSHLETSLREVQKLGKRYRRAAETLEKRTTSGAIDMDELTVDECPEDDIEEVDLADRTCHVAEWLSQLSHKIETETAEIRKKITMNECIDITEREIERIDTFIGVVKIMNVQDLVADYTSAAVPLPSL